MPTLSNDEIIERLARHGPTAPRRVREGFYLYGCRIMYKIPGSRYEDDYGIYPNNGYGWTCEGRYTLHPDDEHKIPYPEGESLVDLSAHSARLIHEVSGGDIRLQFEGEAGWLPCSESCAWLPEYKYRVHPDDIFKVGPAFAGITTDPVGTPSAASTGDLLTYDQMSVGDAAIVVSPQSYHDGSIVLFVYDEEDDHRSWVVIDRGTSTGAVRGRTSFRVRVGGELPASYPHKFRKIDLTLEGLA